MYTTPTLVELGPASQLIKGCGLPDNDQGAGSKHACDNVSSMLEEEE
jgi:hypothetical protein